MYEITPGMDKTEARKCQILNRIEILERINSQYMAENSEMSNEACSKTNEVCSKITELYDEYDSLK